jgi:hypothetical protein
MPSRAQQENLRVVETLGLASESGTREYFLFSKMLDIPDEVFKNKIIQHFFLRLFHRLIKNIRLRFVTI